ncbi:MAG: protein translocase subunit SecD [Candidatus Andersenbacteria bacterium]|nr:protein translocase subunit SecD [bacterium]MDZ4225783.1 protein translocase subunit SecD [Candidatus Andersenbacteria bacterium]
MTRNKRNILFIGFLAVLTGLAVWIDIPSHPNLRIGSFYRDLDIKLGLDLLGGTHLVYRADVKGVADSDVADAMAGVRDVIEHRVNAFGVAEPVVQTNKVGNEERVIVELAGVHDPQEAIKQIGETPQLDFRREVAPDEAAQQYNIDSQDAENAGPIFERTQLTGKNLKRATVSFGSVNGTPEVNLEFDGEGADLFAQLTKDNLQKRIAIYLDGSPISAPVVQSEITNGKAVISGGFTIDEAKQLAQGLNAGALPVPIELIGQQIIGPTLGQRSIEQSVVAGVLGFMAVVVWMLVFYRLPGLVASLALIVYMSIFMAIIKLTGVTLTLAGVAGFILSIGMAVDANVLIYERFRENLRQGKNIIYAVDNGFAEAWNSIRASNISSLITALILYVFGTSIIRGFAVTFSIGIVLSMFTAITVTSPMLETILRVKYFWKPFWLSAKSPGISGPKI